MRTRTLMLLAVACGLVILVAGGVQLLRVANQDDPPRPVGDRRDRPGWVTWRSSCSTCSERSGSVLVDVELGGVDDDDGADGFSLVVSNGALEADAAAGNHCGATTTRVEPCTLAFRLGDDSGTSRVLVYRRGDQQVHWDLGSS